MLALVLPVGCAGHGLATNTAALMANTDPEDPAVLRAVLEDFAKGDDSLTREKNSVLLIVAESTPLSEESAKWIVNNPGENCKNRQQFRESLLEHRSSVLLAPILPSSPLWRVASTKEAKSSVFDLAPSVKNLINVSAPAYSTDRQSALVVVNFLWSIHDAQRTYVLSRKEGVWRISCSDSFYAV